MSPNEYPRIVVIDDNVDAADMFGWMLEADGYPTRIAYSGRAGLDLAAAFSPHAVFCDLGMPCMSGYEFAAALRTREAGRTPLLLVAVSGWGDARTRTLSAAAGFDVHLVKPTRFEDIRTLLEDRLGGQAGLHSTPAL